MSRENIEAARRVLEEGFNQGNLDALDEVCAEGFVDHDALLGDRGVDGVKESIAAYRAAFPDIEITVEEIFAAGDKVVTRWSGNGTFENDFMGQEATGQMGDPVHGIGIDRFDEDGKIAETWTQWDTLTFLKNIGAVPAGAATAAGS